MARHLLLPSKWDDNIYIKEKKKDFVWCLTMKSDFQFLLIVDIVYFLFFDVLV